MTFDVVRQIIDKDTGNGYQNIVLWEDFKSKKIAEGIVQFMKTKLNYTYVKLKDEKLLVMENTSSTLLPDAKKIRARQSYGFWENMFDYFKGEGVPHKSMLRMLIWLYNVLDQQYAYGSATNSIYHNESLILLLIDKKLI
jgi:hypothetical protein